MTDFMTASIAPYFAKKEQNLYQNPHIFRFFELPNEIKFKIIQSIDEEDGKTFTTLLRVSKAMRNICLVSRHRIVRRLPEIINRESHLAASLYGDQTVGLNQVFQTYIRFHAKVMNHTCFLDRFHAMRINKQMYIQGMTSDCILTSSDVTCDMYLFQEHLMISGARRWESPIRIRKNLLKGLELDACCFTSTDCDDETLLTFRCKDITFLNADPHVSSSITDQGINAFLKQWLAGKRELDSFEFGWTLDQRSIDIILDGLNASPIWTEVDHPNSLLRDYPIAFIEDRMRTSQMNRSYSIWSSSNIYDYRIIEVGDDRLRIEKGPLTETDRMERIVEMFLQ